MSEQEQRVKVPFSLEPIGIDMPNYPPILCSKCGDDIQVGSIDGLCPRCLMPQQESGPSKEEILSAQLSSLRAEVSELKSKVLGASRVINWINEERKSLKAALSEARKET